MSYFKANLEAQRLMILGSLDTPQNIEELLVTFPKWDYFDLLSVLGEMENDGYIICQKRMVEAAKVEYYSINTERYEEED